MSDGEPGAKTNGTGLFERIEPAVELLPEDDRVPWELYYRCGVQIAELADWLRCGRLDLARRIYCANFMVGWMAMLKPDALQRRLRSVREEPQWVDPPASLTSDHVFRSACEGPP